MTPAERIPPKVGDRVRVTIRDGWMVGEVISLSPVTGMVLVRQDVDGEWWRPAADCQVLS